MRKLIRTCIFVYLSLGFAQYVVGALNFGTDELRTKLLVTIALTFLYLALKPVVSLVGIPNRGLGFMFLSFVMTFVVMYVLTSFLPNFTIVPATISGLKLFGFVLPSKSLTALWAGVFAALVSSLCCNFLEFLCSNRKK